jgi:hypothetical protein
MTEDTLKQYFDGLTSITKLYMDVDGSETKVTYDTTEVNVIQLNNLGNYIVTTSHLLKLCNAAIEGSLKFEHLTTIAFALEFSEYFIWDSNTINGDIVANVINDWCNPEINFSITIENLNHWKTYLETGIYNLKFDKKQNGK